MAIDTYIKRISKYLKIKCENIKPTKNASKLSPKELKQIEADQILSRLSPSDKVILLDENGKDLNSLKFADFIQAQMNVSVRNLVFIIGGAYGLADSLRAELKNSIRLSSLTYSHHLARLVLLEQIYRACTIINNEPYHNQ